MKKLLLILAVISFTLPILYFNWVYYVAVYSIPPNEFLPQQNYFIEMYYILSHWTSGEMGWFPIYPTIFGVILLFIRRTFFPQFPQYWYCGLDETPYTDVDDTSVQDSTF